MPSEFVLKNMNRVHRAMMAVTGGRVGWTMAKMPVIELTTTGRKSGQERSTMLTTPWRDGDQMAIVASAGGNDQPPAWYLNLEADPDVTIRDADGSRAMSARITAGDERAELWETISTQYTNYADYQKKTDREIPIVILAPSG
jgi:deazaflavin-dependent oxidoreductase (nitroreductase family)